MPAIRMLCKLVNSQGPAPIPPASAWEQQLIAQFREGWGTASQTSSRQCSRLLDRLLAQELSLDVYLRVGCRFHSPCSAAASAKGVPAD